MSLPLRGDFAEMVGNFQPILMRILPPVFTHSRYRLKDQREVQIDTIFGTVRFKRRLYRDRVKGQHVFLLDHMLAFDGREKLSPILEEVAIELPVKVPLTETAPTAWKR